MKYFVIGYAIFTALLAVYVVRQNIEWYSIGLNESVVQWMQYFLVMNIPLALWFSIAGILMVFKVYKAARVTYILLLLFIIWFLAGCPTSVSEPVFKVKFDQLVSSNSEKIDLREVMMGDWEVVCSSDGYDSPVRIKKFDKVFPTVGYPQDGWWGLIFISPDGSYKGVTDNDRGVDLRGCVNRAQAVFYKKGYSYVLPDEVQNEMKEAAKNGEWRMY